MPHLCIYEHVTITCRMASAQPRTGLNPLQDLVNNLAQASASSRTARSDRYGVCGHTMASLQVDDSVNIGSCNPSPGRSCCCSASYYGKDLSRVVMSLCFVCGDYSMCCRCSAAEVATASSSCHPFCSSIRKCCAVSYRQHTQPSKLAQRSTFSTKCKSERHESEGAPAGHACIFGTQLQPAQGQWRWVL